MGKQNIQAEEVYCPDVSYGKERAKGGLTVQK